MHRTLSFEQKISAALQDGRHVRSGVDIAVRNVLGSTRARMELEPNVASVYPGARRPAVNLVDSAAGQH